MKPLKLFSSDLDGTLLGDPASTERFHRLWQSLPEEERPLLVYNSGRLLDDLQELLPDSGLPQADFLIGGVGTMLHHATQMEFSADFTAALGGGFDSEHIAAILSSFPGIRPQPSRYQHAFKSSWFLHDADEDTLSAIGGQLRDAGLDVQVVYSSSRDLDILPRRADKGASLSWLCNRLGFGLDEVAVAGDTNNDRRMFELPQVRGIIVGNAFAELRQLSGKKDRIYAASAPMAAGVIEGLTHWGLFTP